MFMRFQGLVLALVMMGAVPALEHTAVAGEKWSCQKEGKEVKVKGKKAADKQKQCEEQGGTWEKAAKKGDHGHEHAEGSEEQSSGSGGSW
jgi:hypothetical protein